MLTNLFRRSKPARKPQPGLGLVALESREVPATFTVTSTFDAGAGSLRQALSGANAAAGSDLIVFDASFNTARTITLASELIITDGVIIRGPGMDLLTIQGNDTFRLMGIDAAIGKAQTLNISGMTLTKGDAPGPSQEGGAVRLAAEESLLAIDVRFKNNDAYNGGAVYADFSEVNPFMNFRDCVFEGNSGRYGGAVYSSGDRDVTFLNCIAAGNTAPGDGNIGWGGVVCVNGDEGDLSITGCTFTGNSAAIGGAIRTVHSGNVFIADSLFNDNSASAYGGAITIHSWSDPGSWVIRNSTISDNTAVSGGGAVTFSSFFGIPDTLRLENCTVTANTGGTHAGGLWVFGDVSAESSIITGNTATTNPDVEVEDAVTLKNSVLGVTAGAVVIDDGGNFIAKSPAQIMLGALADNGGLRLSHALAADSPLLNKGSNSAAISNDARGGGFPRSANGGVDIGSYERNISFIVTNANDAGPGSLRQALADADLSAGTSDFVTFDPVFFASPRTILLSDQILIYDPVEIQGPGAGFVTITNPTQRALWVNFDAVDGDIEEYAVSGITFANNQGQASGGAMVGSYGSIAISDCVFTANGTAGGTGEGGAINMFQMDVTIDNCVFSNNKALDEGGAIFARNGLVIRNSTLNNNTAVDSGGAIFLGTNGGGTQFDVDILNSTLSANLAGETGGAIAARDGSGTVSVFNSTIVGNAAKVGGGLGDGLNAFLGVELVSSVVAYNSAFNEGPDIECDGVVTMKNSAVFSASGFFGQNLGGNLASGIDYKLGLLKDNGGAGKTHAPQTGSPLINAGTNSAGLARDQRGGTHLRSVGTGVDIGAVEVQAPPRVASVAVDNNTGQRSMVRSLTVTFTRVVNLAGGFDVVRTSSTGPSGPVPFTVDTSLSTPQETIAKLTFTDSAFTQFGSLIDGDYRLIVIASQVTDGSGQQLDGNGNGTGGDSHFTLFHRLFGDVNGDRTVDGSTDFAAFGNTYGLSASQPGFNSAFDFNNDGTIDGSTDFAQFGARFGVTI